MSAVLQWLFQLGDGAERELCCAVQCSGFKKSYIRICELSHGRLKQDGRAIEVCSPLDDWWVSSVLLLLLFQLGDGAERAMLCYVLCSVVMKWDTRLNTRGLRGSCNTVSAVVILSLHSSVCSFTALISFVRSPHSFVCSFTSRTRSFIRTPLITPIHAGFPPIPTASRSYEHTQAQPCCWSMVMDSLDTVKGAPDPNTGNRPGAWELHGNQVSLRDYARKERGRVESGQISQI